MTFDNEKIIPKGRSICRSVPKATGPRTLAGKKRSRWNSTRHGISAATTLLPDESVSDFQKLRKGLFAYFGPQGTPEGFLVDQLAVLLWRQLRVWLAERAVWESAGRPPVGRKNGRSFEAILYDIRRRQAASDGDSTLRTEPDLAFLDEPATTPELDFSLTLQAPALEAVMRVEVHLSREIDRLLNRLDRLQRRRAGQLPPPPLEVNVSVDSVHSSQRRP